MVEELAQVEKEARRNRRRTRILYILIGLDVLLLGYAIFQIIALAIALAK